MQEFESVSASSYDPSALATKLTAKAAEGWAVVAIVPTGGDVTAFLSRDNERRRVDEPAERRGGRPTRPPHPCCRPTAEPPPSRARARADSRKPSASHLAGRSPPSRATPAADDGRRRGHRRSTPHRRPTSRSPPYQPARRRSRRRCPGRGRRAPNLHRRRRCPPAGTPTRPAASSCATGTAAPGPSTCRAPASSSPTRPSPDHRVA